MYVETNSRCTHGGDGRRDSGNDEGSCGNKNDTREGATKGRCVASDVPSKYERI
jgi:hypothetical protein